MALENISTRGMESSGMRVILNTVASTVLESLPMLLNPMDYSYFMKVNGGMALSMASALIIMIKTIYLRAVGTWISKWKASSLTLTAAYNRPFLLSPTLIKEKSMIYLIMRNKDLKVKHL